MKKREKKTQNENLPVDNSGIAIQFRRIIKALINKVSVEIEETTERKIG